MRDDLIVCRCEEVTVGEVRDAIRRGGTTVTGIKRRTRAGMGTCQGRTCQELVARILSEELGRTRGDFPADASRPPAVPVPFRSLAGEEDC